MAFVTEVLLGKLEAVKDTGPKVPSMMVMGERERFCPMPFCLGPVCPRFSTLTATVYLFLLCLSLAGCHPHLQAPVTITILDPEWSHDTQERHLSVDALLQEFTRETAIQVKRLPAPETSPDQLALTKHLLEEGALTPDVYGIDVIWPGILKQYLIDMNPYFKPEVASQDPDVLANYTVHGKLVAMPYHANVGVLYYRTDLMLRYGYNDPPRTWNELERMAIRIQAGERAKGETEFWGLVWPGAPSEGLTCNALEWQAAEEGGPIIETSQVITVNNPRAIRSWERARHWVGSISPPSVASYREWDASNAFWISGRAAFFRGWTSDYFLSHPPEKPFRDKSGVTSVPGDSPKRVGILGGFGLGVSKSSLHQPEAIALVQFLVRKEAELETARSQAAPPERPQMFELPVILKAYARPGAKGSRPGANVLARPSTVTGLQYAAVSEAYAQAVHSVVTGASSASDAAAALENNLVHITGFSTVRH